MWESASALMEYDFIPETVGTEKELDRIGRNTPRMPQDTRQAKDLIEYTCTWCGACGGVLGRESDLRRNLAIWAIQLATRKRGDASA